MSHENFMNSKYCKCCWNKHKYFIVTLVGYSNYDSFPAKRLCTCCIYGLKSIKTTHFYGLVSWKTVGNIYSLWFKKKIYHKMYVQND